MTYDELVDYCKEASQTISELDCKNRILEKSNEEYKTQQKEFIKYLEDEIKEEKDDLEKLCKLYKIPKENNGAYKFAYSYINKMEAILEKYKEMVGSALNVKC